MEKVINIFYMAFGKEIKRLREKAKMSAQSFADSCGIDAERLRKWEQRDIDPRHDDAFKIEEAYGVAIDDFIKLKSLPRVQNIPNENILQEAEIPYNQRRLLNKNKAETVLVPLINVKAQAGYRKSYNNTDFLNTMELYPIVPGIDPHGAIWRYFQVDGDSMLDFLNDGDYVLGSQVPKEDWAELKDFLVYVIVTDDLVTVKHVAKRKQGKELVLIPKNESFDQVAINMDTVKEIWKYRRHIGWNASSPKKLEIKI